MFLHSVCKRNRRPVTPLDGQTGTAAETQVSQHWYLSVLVRLQPFTMRCGCGAFTVIVGMTMNTSGALKPQSRTLGARAPKNHRGDLSRLSRASSTRAMNPQEPT